MDERLIEKFQRLVNGNERAAHHAHIISNLKNPRACHAVVDWLLRVGIHGDRLVEFIKEKHQGDTFKMISHVVGEINRAPKRPVLAGDYLCPKGSNGA